MQVDLVVRGLDLLPSTARQMYLGRALGAGFEPRYAHVPLVLSAEGERVAKRTRGTTVRELTARGVEAASLFGFLGHAAGLFPDATPRDLTRALAEARLDALAAPPGVRLPPAFM